MKRIMMVVLTAEERQAMSETDWGCFTRDANRRVGTTLARLLTEGFVLPSVADDLAEFVAEQSGVEEVADTQAQEILWARLKLMRKGTFPLMLADRHSDEA